MRYRTVIAAAAIFLSVSAAPAVFAGPEPMPVAGTGSQTGVTAQDEKNAVPVPVTEEPPQEAPVKTTPEAVPEEPGVMTVKGIVSAVDPDAHTITMSTAAGEKTLSYGEGTRFQSGLKSIDTEDVQVGSRIAVLYEENDGKASLKRVMLVPDKSYGPTKPGSYHSGRHGHGKQSRGKKAHGKKPHGKRPHGGKAKSHKKKAHKR